MFLGADGNPLEGEEPVAKSRPRNDASGGWIDGDANPFVGGQAGEDPIKTAAKEMQATTAMFAMQKAQMMGAGMGAIIGGGVPSADQIRAWQNGDTPSIQTNPYDHLTREEKIALIGQLQKSKAANEAHERQSALEGASPTDMVDPSVYLAKGGSKGPVATQYAPPKTQKQAPPPPVAPTADRAAPMAKAGAHVEGCQCDRCLSKGGPAPAPMSSTHLKKPEKSEIEEKEERAALGPKVNMRKSMDFALQAFNATSSPEGLKKSFEILQKCMKAGSDEYAGTPFEKEALDATIEFKKATISARKEKLDESGSARRWEKMDAIRKAYYDKLDELELKSLEHKRKMMDMSKAAQGPDALDDLDTLRKSMKKAAKANPFAVCHASVGPEKSAKYEDCVQDVKKKQGLKKAGDPFASLDDSVDHPRPGPQFDTIRATEQPAPGGASSEERENTRPDGPGSSADKPFEKNKKKPAPVGIQAKGFELKKSEGEGTRGGKVIGHTSSGKAIYATDHMSPTETAHSASIHADQLSADSKGTKKAHKGTGNPLDPKHGGEAAHKKAQEAHEQAAAYHAHAAGHNAEGSFHRESHERGASYHQMRAKEHGVKAEIAHHLASAESGDKAHHLGQAMESARKLHDLPHGNPEEKKKVMEHVRGKVEGHIFSHTHKDYKSGKGADRAVMHHGPGGSSMSKLSQMSHEQLHEHGKKTGLLKSENTMKTHKKLQKAIGKLDAFASGDILHKNVDHPRPGAEMVPATGFEPGKRRAPDQSVQGHAMANSSNSSPSNAYEAPHGVGDDESEENKQGGSFVDHPREGGALSQESQFHKPGGFEPSHPQAQGSREGQPSKKKTKLQKAMGKLEAFSKGEGQGGMPEAGDPPHSFPTGRRAVDGGELAGVGDVGSEAQDAGEATAGSTSHAEGSGEDENLRALAAMHDSPGAGKADLESEAGGSRMQKGWVDWNQAADDGEYLRAQMVSQLMNKSMDVEVGIGVKRAQPFQKSERAAPTPSKAYLQKGGAAVYLDGEDAYIEKSMERVSGLVFSQGSQVNVGAPIQHEAACPNCNALTKSYLSSCTECGSPLHGHRVEAQGLRIEKSVAATLIPTDEDEVQIG